MRRSRQADAEGVMRHAGRARWTRRGAVETEPTCSGEDEPVRRGTLRAVCGAERERKRGQACSGRYHSMEFMVRHEKTTCFGGGRRDGLAVPGSGFLGVEEIARVLSLFWVHFARGSWVWVVRALVCARLWSCVPDHPSSKQLLLSNENPAQEQGRGGGKEETSWARSEHWPAARSSSR